MKCMIFLIRKSFYIRLFGASYCFIAFLCTTFKRRTTFSNGVVKFSRLFVYGPSSNSCILNATVVVKWMNSFTRFRTFDSERQNIPVYVWYATNKIHRIVLQFDILVKCHLGKEYSRTRYECLYRRPKVKAIVHQFICHLFW